MPASDHVVNPNAFLPDSAQAATSPRASSIERELENSLRPAGFHEFVGQRRVVDNLRIAITAAQEREEALDHVLLSGPPGLGKTSLARILTAEIDVQLHTTSGPALERPRDLVGILTQLQPGDVFFVDEIHRVPISVEEYLYSAMEDYSVDFTLDQGPNARILPLKIAPFTLVGATTREGLLSAPMRSRFGLLERLSPYPDEDLIQILLRSAKILKVALTPSAAAIIASRSRGTPRVANRFLRRARDVAQVHGANEIDESLANDSLERLGVDANGLEEMDRKILDCLCRSQGRAVGLKTIAASVGESEDTIEEVFEPHLLRKGFIEKTARGRLVTAQGASAVGVAFGNL